MSLTETQSQQIQSSTAAIGSAAAEEDVPRIAVLIGSTRPGRSGPAVARWFLGEAERGGAVQPVLVDLADADLPSALVSGAQVSRGVRELRARLADADGFVVITPEYNHSFPAALKQAIDLTGKEWQAKPVAFVSYGGRSGGLRAVEQLRQIYPEMHATTIRETVTFHGIWDYLGADGELRADKEQTAAAHLLIDQLAWWAHTLRAGRVSRPYAG
jgi:NAD(P)H-dependent FMN reductase